MPSDRNPLLIGVHVAPPSSVRKAPAAEIAMNIRCGFFGSRRIVCSPSPPAPGAQKRPDPWPRRPGSSFHVCPPSVVRNIAASSTPAYTVSGSVSDGSKCQTRLNSHGCGVPSYHRCLPTSPSYTNLLLSPLGVPSGVIVSPGGVPGWCHVLPPSSERWMICPNQPLVCDA